MLPAIFFGHGNPMNAILSNGYTEAWRDIGQQITRPLAILSISAHWYLPDTRVTVSTAPRTIHDFGGFSPELYQVQYPAPGDPALARRVQGLLSPLDVTLDNSWGLDHGTLVGAPACLSRGRHSGRAAQYRRDKAGRITF
jgi:4,5-DOPA dioxygenase extradiol